jgi:hypothetical protein
MRNLFIDRYRFISNWSMPLLCMDTLSQVSYLKSKILRQRYDRPWYELYDAGKPVIVGHYIYSGTDQPFNYRDKVYGLDTDCVTGKALTGILLPSF